VNEEIGAPPYRPVLSRVPDGRRANAPLFDPLFFGYAALMLGAFPASLAALYNAAALRRWKTAALAVLIGIGGWVGFGLVLGALFLAGVKNAALAVFAGRVFSIALGALLAYTQWGHVRGHRILGGRRVPLLYAVLGALALQLVLPRRVILLLIGVVV
jgi:hypothetical protein